MIESERLTLRMPIHSDALAIYKAYTTDSEVTKYLIWEPHKSLQDSQEWILHCIDRYRRSKDLPFVIEEKNSKKVIGMFDVREIKPGHAEFGYVLAKAYWNKGYMSEAGIAVMNYCRKNTDFTQIEANHHVDNLASGKVIEKMGLTKVGSFPGGISCPNISDQLCDAILYKSDFSLNT